MSRLAGLLPYKNNMLKMSLDCLELGMIYSYLQNESSNFFNYIANSTSLTAWHYCSFWYDLIEVTVNI
jgi:hypothetical protein